MRKDTIFKLDSTQCHLGQENAIFVKKRDKYDFHKFAKSLNIVTELKSNYITGVSISKCSPFC